jgi:hypothetical protein
MSKSKVINVDFDFLQKNPNINEKKYTTPLSVYSILNYIPTELGEDSIECLNYHSVILDNSSRKILSIAPPKPIDIPNSPTVTFENKKIQVTEYIEGTYIHLFYDPFIFSWEIATKKAIGGNYSFYHIPDQYSLTYREMFMEAFGLSKNTHIDDVPFLPSLDKNKSYGFVLQHPQNHIVMKIQKPRIYLVSVYEIDLIKTTVTFISPEIYEQDPIFEKYSIHFPKSFDLQKYPVEEYIRVHASIHTPLIIPGIMITDVSTGQTYAQINPNYLELAELRGNQPNIQYQYLCLRRIHKVAAFLQHFPQYNSVFTQYKIQYDTFVTNVHQSYLSYYVRKEGIMISPKYFPTIYEIHHSIFIPSMTNKEKIIIRRKVVKDFIDQMDPAKILFLLNYDHHYTTYKNDADFLEKIDEDVDI